MKKIFSSIFCLAIALSFTMSFATTHHVDINDTSFGPNNFTADVGDTVLWTNASSSLPHTTTSTAVPGGAAAWNEIVNNQGSTYMYVITTVGTYDYKCAYHSFTGSFTVTATHIQNVLVDSKLVFPNPFNDKVMVSYNKPGAIMVYNVLGNKVADLNLETPGQAVELNFQNLHPGVYFITLMSEGNVVETRKVIKNR